MWALAAALAAYVVVVLVISRMVSKLDKEREE